MLKLVITKCYFIYLCYQPVHISYTFNGFLNFLVVKQSMFFFYVTFVTLVDLICSHRNVCTMLFLVCCSYSATFPDVGQENEHLIQVEVRFFRENMNLFPVYQETFLPFFLRKAISCLHYVLSPFSPVQLVKKREYKRNPRNLFL